MRHELALVPEEEPAVEVGLKPLARNGYGKDPNLRTPTVPWSGTLSEHELNQIEALSDFFLPETLNHPSPSQVGIKHFFDQWLSAPYPRQSKDKAIILQGLSHLDPISASRHGKLFLQLSSTELNDVVAYMHHSWPVESFFTRFRYLVIGGYFTTAAGSDAIGYCGNVPLNHYPGMSSEVEELVEAELSKLGL